MAPLEVIENIEKPTTDKRKYRYARLPNGLQVLLVSEEEAEMSAAALDVNVGSFFDPVEAQGLAHFCEHMLFLGSASFPSEHEYANYIKQHGGMHNACTEQTHTTFFFSVAAAHLEGALERFAAFFVCPLFTAAAAAREAQAVDSEFRLRRANDAVRRWHLMHHLSNPQHPFSRFSCGNLASLTAAGDLETGVRQQLLQFYNKWYSANIMTLTVLGRESLDELQRIVQRLFERVENKHVPTMPSLTLLATERHRGAAATGDEGDTNVEQETQRTMGKIKEEAGSGTDGPGEDASRGDGGGRKQADTGGAGRRSREDDEEGKEKRRQTGTEGGAGQGTGSRVTPARESTERKRQDGEEEGNVEGAAASEASVEGGVVTSSVAGEGKGDILPVFRRGIDLEKVVYVMPVKDFKEIHFQFVLPPLLKKWRSKPARFVGHLVGHEGRGSLLAALKKLGLASGLNAWCLEEECVSIFHVSIELTELGISDAGLSRVSELVLRYVQLLRAQPPAPWLFKEKQELAKLHFLFADKEDALSFCATHAKRLHLYPPEQTLSGAHLFFTYDATDVQEVLQNLTLENLRVEIVGKRFEEKCDQTEAIYGVVYGVHDIPPQQKNLWTKILSASPQEAVAAAAAEGLHYPAPNPFIPTDLSLRNSPLRECTAAGGVNSASGQAAATEMDTTSAAHRVITEARAVAQSAGVGEKGVKDTERTGARAATAEAAATGGTATEAKPRAATGGGEVLANGVAAGPAASAGGTADQRTPAGVPRSGACSTTAVQAAPTTGVAGDGGADKPRGTPAVGVAYPRVAGLPAELRVSDIPVLAGKTRFFFKQDDTFFLPKLSVRLWVSTAYSARGVKEWVLSWVYVDTVALMLNEELYDADIAGLFYSLTSGDWPGEVSVALHGFNDKLPLMLHKLTYALAHRGHTQEEEENDGGSNKDAEREQPERQKTCGLSGEAPAGTAGERREETEAGDKSGPQTGVGSKEGMMLTQPAVLREERDARDFRAVGKEELKEGDAERHQKDKAGRQKESQRTEKQGDTESGTSNVKGLDRNMYELVKESLLRRLKNRLMYRTVYQQAMTVCGEALEEPFYSYEEQIAALEAIQFEEVEAVADQLFYRAHVEGLAVGNMHEQECVRMLARALENLNIQETGTNLSPKAVLDLSAVDLSALSSAEAAKEDPRKPQQHAGGNKLDRGAEKRTRAGEQSGDGYCGGKTEKEGGGSRDPEEDKTLLVAGREASAPVRKGETVYVRVQQKNPNPEDYNNAAFIRLQLGELELRERAMLALLSHWLEQPFFDEMRTQQQLGYVTQASKNVQLRTHTLDFFIASKYPPSLLASRMEAFLEMRLFAQLERLQEELSEDLFELHRRALISELSVKPQNIYEETQRYVVEIYFKSFLFDRYPQTIKQLESLSRDECFDFIRHTLTRAPALMLWIHAQQQQQQENQQQKCEAAETRRLLAAGRSDGPKERENTDKGAESRDQTATAAAKATEDGGPARDAKGAAAETVGGEAASVAKEGTEEGKGDAEISTNKGEGGTDEGSGVTKDERERSEVNVKKDEKQNTENLEKDWVDVSHPRRLRDFASRRFVMPV